MVIYQRKNENKSYFAMPKQFLSAGRVTKLAMVSVFRCTGSQPLTVSLSTTSTFCLSKCTADLINGYGKTCLLCRTCLIYALSKHPPFQRQFRLRYALPIKWILFMCRLLMTYLTEVT